MTSLGAQVIHVYSILQLKNSSSNPALPRGGPTVYGLENKVVRYEGQRKGEIESSTLVISRMRIRVAVVPSVPCRPICPNLYQTERLAYPSPCLFSTRKQRYRVVGREQENKKEVCGGALGRKNERDYAAIQNPL